MTRMLASVRDAGEAALAVEAGVDIVDVKDPDRGSLGALAAPAVAGMVEAVGGRTPVSAVAGGPDCGPERLAEAVREMAGTGVDLVKIGLYPGQDGAALIRALAEASRQVRMVAVLFADAEPDAALLPALSAAGFAGAMLDTLDKRNGRLLVHKDATALRDFVRAAKAAGLLAGLAGSLEAPDIPRLLPLAPDVLGFRGALCLGEDRTARLDLGKTAAIRALIPRRPEGGLPRLADYRLLADRHYARDETADASSTDRVYVRDLSLPVYIGAYRRERDEPQRVRFNVVAEVRRRGRPDDDMQDVFSYDVIIDAIRAIVAEGHVALVETLAERVAAATLEHPSVRGVVVRVEKLDVGPGAVGIEIERRRGSGTANILELFPTSIGGAGPKAAS